MANGMPTMNSAGMGELFARLRFVLIALLIYRVGTHIPVPRYRSRAAVGAI